MRLHALLVVALIVAAGCDSSSGDLLEIDATGVVDGIVVRDSNANGAIDAGDVPASNLLVALVQASVNDTVASMRTDATGAFRFANVPVGHYTVVLPALADSLAIVFRDPPGEVVTPGTEGSAAVLVAAADTVDVTLAIAYPVVSIPTARALPPGRRVFVRSAALAPSSVVVPNAGFIQDSTGQAIIATGIAAGLIAGDSVLVLGTTGVRDGQPALLSASAQILGTNASIDTFVVTAGSAANASSGTLDANLVRLNDVLITDTTTVGERLHITVEDPSGEVVVSVQAAGAPTFAPGDTFERVVGILVPSTTGSAVWEIRPRSGLDLQLES